MSADRYNAREIDEAARALYRQEHPGEEWETLSVVGQVSYRERIVDALDDPEAFDEAQAIADVARTVTSVVAQAMADTVNDLNRRLDDADASLLRTAEVMDDAIRAAVRTITDLEGRISDLERDLERGR